MFRVLVVGTSKRKNIDMIYSIVGKLNHIKFIFVGDYNNYLGFENLEIQSKISENELQVLYQSSNLLLFPSISEGFGLPIIEAQFFKLPVITSNKEPMKSVAGIGGALFVNPISEREIIDAILEVQNNGNLVNELVKNGLDNVKKYSINTIIAQYNSLYSTILLT